MRRFGTFGRFQLFFEVFYLACYRVVHVEMLLDTFGKIFVVFRVIFHQLMQNVTCKSWQTLRTKTCRKYLSTSILCSWSSRQRISNQWLALLATPTWRNITSMSAESAVWCSLNHNVIPVRLFNRPCPERTSSLKATFSDFAALALHTSPTFSGLCGQP